MHPVAVLMGELGNYIPQYQHLSACPAYSGLADFALEKTLPLYFVDEKHLVGI